MSHWPTRQSVPWGDGFRCPTRARDGGPAAGCSLGWGLGTRPGDDGRRGPLFWALAGPSKTGMTDRGRDWLRVPSPGARSGLGGHTSTRRTSKRKKRVEIAIRGLTVFELGDQDAARSRAARLAGPQRPQKRSFCGGSGSRLKSVPFFEGSGSQKGPRWMRRCRRVNGQRFGRTATSYSEGQRQRPMSALVRQVT